MVDSYLQFRIPQEYSVDLVDDLLAERIIIIQVHSFRGHCEVVDFFRSLVSRNAHATLGTLRCRTLQLPTVMDLTEQNSTK